MMNPDYLNHLVCPVSKQTLRYDAEHQELISEAAKLAYPIHDGIPILLKEQARSLETDSSTVEPSADISSEKIAEDDAVSTAIKAATTSA